MRVCCGAVVWARQSMRDMVHGHGVAMGDGDELLLAQVEAGLRGALSYNTQHKNTFVTPAWDTLPAPGYAHNMAASNRAV